MPATDESPLLAPFPYYGGKRRFAPIVWDRLGDPDVYAEPFAGSLAVLLQRPAEQIPRSEVICDTNGHVCNFWRALVHAPDEVAHHADYPTFHHDLTARHRWLVKWGRENLQHLIDDADWYDPKAAGWWCWGMSSWIGGGFCSDYREKHDLRPYQSPTTGRGVQVQKEKMPHDSRPKLADGRETGAGVQVQRKELPGHEKRPMIQKGKNAGQGVQVQRENVEIQDRRPHLQRGQGVQAQKPHDKRPIAGTHATSGKGVQVQRGTVPGDETVDKAMDEIGDIGTGRRLMPWFYMLAQRLAKVIVLNRDWTSGVTRAVLRDYSDNNYTTAIFMDPPYLTESRDKTVYQSDLDGESDDVARQSWEWAVDHGKEYRIAYACHEGDFELPAGWTAETMSFGGIRSEDRTHRRDMVMFSPACLDSPQADLFA